jgi:hypothetical protein
MLRPTRDHEVALRLPSPAPDQLGVARRLPTFLAADERVSPGKNPFASLRSLPNAPSADRQSPPNKATPPSRPSPTESTDSSSSESMTARDCCAARDLARFSALASAEPGRFTTAQASTEPGALQSTGAARGWGRI